MRYGAGEAVRPMVEQDEAPPGQPTTMRCLRAAAAGRPGAPTKNPRGGCRRAQYVESHFAK